MKYDEVPQNYHSPYMAQVADKLSILKMTPEDRARYSYYQKKLYNDRDELSAAVSRGREEGKEEGIEIGERVKAFEVARRMLLKGISVENIMYMTDLSKDEIENISKN